MNLLGKSDQEVRNGCSLNVGQHTAFTESVHSMQRSLQKGVIIFSLGIVSVVLDERWHDGVANVPI